jgi:tagatose 6-phosphate kinase
VIVSAGLTPAWQQILRFNRLDVGEVNRAVEAHWCGSGKVLNVGIALAHLTGHAANASRTISPLGGPAYGVIEEEFARLKIPRRWIETQAPTRVCTTLLDEATHTATELVENANPLTVDELQSFLSVFAQEAARADWVVLAGSLPAGTPSSFYRDLLDQTTGQAVLDARGDELLLALERRPFLVKPNREELARTAGQPLADDASLHAAMRELNDRGAEWVVVSQGKDAVWASSRGRVHRLIPPVVSHPVNPIGCGDCLAAGITWGLSLGHPPIESIRLGIAAAGENLKDLLPARLDPDRVIEIAEKILVESA